MADVADSSRKAIDGVDPTPYFGKYGENFWAGLKGYLDEIAANAAAPVIESTPVCSRRPTWSRRAWRSK